VQRIQRIELVTDAPAIIVRRTVGEAINRGDLKFGQKLPAADIVVVKLWEPMNRDGDKLGRNIAFRGARELARQSADFQRQRQGRWPMMPAPPTFTNLRCRFVISPKLPRRNNKNTRWGKRSPRSKGVVVARTSSRPMPSDSVPISSNIVSYLAAKRANVGVWTQHERTLRQSVFMALSQIPSGLPLVLYGSTAWRRNLDSLEAMRCQKAGHS
jgi:hypothetical protein